MNPDKSHYVVATCVVVKEGKFLITKRSPTEKESPNKWTIPGGKLEVKDYKEKKKDTSNAWYNILENLAKREVLEETGLKIKNIRYLTSLVFIRESDSIPVLVVSMYADYDSGDVVLEPGIGGHAWVDIESAKNYDLIDGIYEELVMLDGIQKYWAKK